MIADFRYAFRALRQVPGVTAAAVLTIALGVGATSAIFSVLNGLYFRPVAGSDPDRLVPGGPRRSTRSLSCEWSESGSTG